VNQEVRQVAKAKADEVLALLGRAVELLDRGDSGQAVKEAERAKRMATRSASVREVLALALYEQERYREALTEMQAYKRMSGRADQNHIIADCYRALGQPQKAVQFADEAVRARIPDEARAESVVVGASALADMGKVDQALAMLHRFTTRGDVGREYDLRVWYVTGDILEQSGRRDEAAAEFRKIVRHDAAAYDAAERLAQLESA
jgi:tetratricopeptide (TPR) repeat protein